MDLHEAWYTPVPARWVQVLRETWEVMAVGLPAHRAWPDGERVVTAAVRVRACYAGPWNT